MSIRPLGTLGSRRVAYYNGSEDVYGMQSEDGYTTPRCNNSSSLAVPPSPMKAVEKRPHLSIPTVNSDKENFDDGLLSPRRLAQGLNAFGAMRNAGANWGAALVHAIQGHKMTEEQAALCIQSHWRKHEAVVDNVARVLAAEFIQRFVRERAYKRDQRLQAEMLAAMIQQESYEVAYEARAATKINMTWRGHLARMHVKKLREARAPKGFGGITKRSLSFGKSKRSKATPAASPMVAPDFAPAVGRATTQRSGVTSTAPPVLSELPVENKQLRDLMSALLGDPVNTEVAPVAAPTLGGGSSRTGSSGVGSNTTSSVKKVMRSLSFGRKSSSSSSSSSSSNSSKPVAVSATRRTFVLERGQQGLGLELDSTNTIVHIKPGGRAEKQGLVRVEDVVLSVDGRSCAGKLMQEVMVPGRSVYVVEISRTEYMTGRELAKATSAIRRSLSFDKKASTGIKRSFSFDRKKW